MSGGLFYKVISAALNNLSSSNNGEKQSYEQINQRLINLQDYFISILRRELAIYLIKKDDQQFKKTFYKLVEYEKDMERNVDRVLLEYKAIISKYPNFQDFDVIGVRHFVIYDSDSNTYIDFDTAIEAYSDFSKLLILNRLIEGHCLGASLTNAPYKLEEKFRIYDDKEVKIFQKNITEFIDNKFRNRLFDAMSRFENKYFNMEDEDLSKLITFDPEKKRSYKDRNYQVYELNQEGYFCCPFGVHLRETDEFGLVEKWHNPDGKIDRRYFRCDLDFQNRNPLYEYERG
jgi:hypothetical protein